MDVASEEHKMEIEDAGPRANNTQDSTSEKKSDWVVKLEKELAKSVDSSGRSTPVVFSVPKVFLASYPQFYIPSLISVGPYHFGKEEVNDMEPHKTEALRRMQKRIRDRKMQSIVEEKIVAMDNNIREFYDKELPYSPNELGWMLTEDSCFLFEFMLNYLRTRKSYSETQEVIDCVVKVQYDAVFDATPINPMWKNILYDLVLVENQIPLSVLQCLLQIVYSKKAEEILGGILNGIARLNSNVVFTWGMPEPYGKLKPRHFLDVLYYRHVCGTGEPAVPELADYLEEAYSVKDGQWLKFCRWIKSIFTCFCGLIKSIFTRFWRWIKSIFTYFCSWWMRGRDLAHSRKKNPAVAEPAPYQKKGDSAEDGQSGCMKSIGWTRAKVAGDEFPVFRVKLPSAVELSKKGVNLRAVTKINSKIEDNPQGIRWVRFDGETSTLYLPEVQIDPLRHALLRNFIELEYTSQYKPYPITSFAFFMNELVDSEEDVALLRERNIIKNSFGSNKEAAECFNGITEGYHKSEGCKPVDDARVGLHKYLRREYKILWSEFISTYFAKPWLVAGSVAATLLLVMTMVQVYCLFYTCTLKSED